ncbi:uncharacterized protein LOC110383789 isoform X2 [Helicoverpa armigera]|uniref:uncharacterized protein LOC110383789 isoform X2 n=1 Tax=Helicoverpa armigera TaxID=29058 RepID=UPI0030838169
MMKIIFLVFIPLAWSYGPNTQGGGAFAYVDSTGNRYGGTYGLEDGKVVRTSGDPIPEHFADTVDPYHGADFGPLFFGNFDNLLQEYPPFGGFGMPMSGFGNSAFASASAGPGYQHHVAAISPSNPRMPNVDRVSHFADTSLPDGRKYYSVSSKSYSSSSNINGREISNRGAETLVNDNGKVTHYKVQN